MLEVYDAPTKQHLDAFVRAFMNGLNQKGNWAVAQPDCDKMVFPAKFVIVVENNISLATIHQLKKEQQ